MDTTCGKLNQFRMDEIYEKKKVDNENIEDYLGKTVEGYVKWKLREKYSVEIREECPQPCWVISRAVENISKAVLNHHIVPMFKIKFMVSGLFQHCDNLVYSC